MDSYSGPHGSGHSSREVTAVVKWFNPTKGFGFVQPSDGSPDAFLHISVVEQIGHSDFPDGTTIVCEVSEGEKGPQVASISRVESLPAAPAPGQGTVVDGTVKFFNAEKGFGFARPDDGGKDVFVSARTLVRAGLHTLEPDQRIRMTTSAGQKGPAADHVEII